MLKHWPWLVWGTLVILSMLQITRTGITTDVTAFLPGAGDARQRLIISQLSDGPSTRLVVIGLVLPEDSAATRKTTTILPQETALLASMSKRLRERLAAMDSIAWVSNGDLSHHQPERDRLFAARYVLSSSVNHEAFTATGLHDSFLELQNELVSSRSLAVRSIAAADPTLESLNLLARSSGTLASMRQDGEVWFSNDGRAALLVFATVASGTDVTAVTATIDRAQAEAQQILQDWPAQNDDEAQPTRPTPVVGFAGSGYFNATSQRAIGSESLMLVLLALSLISILMLWTLRSPRVLLLALLPVASGALAGYAVIGLGYGSIHATTIGFGVTLLGEAVDYVIYTSVQRGADGRHSSQFWSKLWLAVLTSLTGFAAMVLSGFQGLQQLGLFSIIGLTVAALCTRFLIPKLLAPPASPPVLASTMGGASALTHLPTIARRARRLRWLVIMVTLLAGLWLHQREAPLWQDSLEVLSSGSIEKTTRDLEWRQAIDQPDLRTMLVVNGKDLEQALERAEAIQPALINMVDDGQLEAFHNPATWLPSAQTQTTRLAALPSEELLRERIVIAVRDTQLRASAFEPFIAAVSHSREHGQLTLADYAGTITGDWLEGQIVRSTDGVNLLILLTNAPPSSTLDSWLADLKVPGVSVMDLQREVESLVATYRMKALFTALLGAAGIITMLALRVRRIDGVASMAGALITCVVLTSSLLVVSAGSLSVFHLVALLLVAGVVSNYTLFFASLPLDANERRQVSLSVVLAASATVIAFAMLAWSSTPLLSKIGSTVAIGAVMGLMAALVFSREEAIPSVTHRANN